MLGFAGLMLIIYGLWSPHPGGWHLAAVISGTMFVFLGLFGALAVLIDEVLSRPPRIPYWLNEWLLDFKAIEELIWSSAEFSPVFERAKCLLMDWNKLTPSPPKGLSVQRGQQHICQRAVAIRSFLVVTFPRCTLHRGQS